MVLMITLSKESDYTWRKRINLELHLWFKVFDNSSKPFFYHLLFISECALLFASNNTLISHPIVEQYWTLKFREGLYPLAKLVPHLCLLVKLTGNLTMPMLHFANHDHFHISTGKWNELNLQLTARAIIKRMFYI